MREILESALPATPATVGVEASARSTSPLVRFVRRRPRTFEDEQHVDRLALPFHLCCVAKLASFRTVLSAHRQSSSYRPTLRRS